MTLSKKKGRYVYFTAGGEAHRAKLSGKRTKVKIAGKKAKTKNLKAGMKCNVTYPGHHGMAKEISPLTHTGERVFFCQPSSSVGFLTQITQP